MLLIGGRDMDYKKIFGMGFKITEMNEKDLSSYKSMKIKINICYT